MPQAANIYANALVQAWDGNIDLATDTLKMGLLANTYTPSLVSDTFWADVNSNEVTGTGYTAGGVTLTGTSLVLTAANSWSVSRANSTAYAYGQVAIPASPNGFLYRCVAAGTSGGSPPSFPTTVGLTVTDGSVTWATLGDAILILTSDPAQWTTATFTANYAVLYDAQSGSASTDPLIVLETFAAPATPLGQNYEVAPDPILGWFNFSPPS
jgi:hypothetical protein